MLTSMKAQRFDAGTLSSPKKQPNGTLKADAYLTRSGVFLYRNADGSERRELRPVDEVFSEDSLETLRMTSLTMGHPAKPVTADNARGLAIGSVGQDVRQDGSHVRATISVIDGESIATMQRGRRQISCGYWCDLEMTKGITEDGEHYDAIQRNIVYNHAAIVDRGRAGPDVAARLDEWRNAEDVAVMIVADDDDGANTDSNPLPEGQRKQTDREDGEKKMERKITLDGVTYNFQADDTAFQAINKALTVGGTRADELQAKLDASGEEAARALDAEKARADAAEEKLAGMQKKLDEASDPERVRERIDARLKLEREAEPVLGDNFNKDASDDEIRRAVIGAVSSVDLEGKSDAYVEARYDAAIEAHQAKADAEKKAKDSVAETRKAAAHADSGEDKIAEAKRKAKERNDAKWRNPLSVSKDRAPENISVSG